MSKTEGIDIKVCPIHGNKEYNVEPTHYCKYKIRESCNCKCTCDNPKTEGEEIRDRIMNVARKYDNELRGGTDRGMIDGELAEILANDYKALLSSKSKEIHAKLEKNKIITPDQRLDYTEDEIDSHNVATNEAQSIVKEVLM